jgi:hypothetical protein
LAEWINRDQYFKRYGGLGIDPFDPESKIGSGRESQVLRTAPLEEPKNQATNSSVQVEEFWSAPLEYQNI